MLRHHPDLAAQRAEVQLGEVDAVEEDAPLGRRVEPHQQARQRRLARARPPDEGDEAGRAGCPPTPRGPPAARSAP